MTQHRYSLADLETHGISINGLTPEQQDVLRNLTADELTLLADIKARLDEVGPEVQAHSEIAGAALF